MSIKRYSNEKMLQILFEIIDTYGTDEEALEFIEKKQIIHHLESFL